MHIKIALDAKPILKLLHDIPKEIIPVATARALNKTAQSVQSVAVKKISTDMGIKQATVRKSFSIEKANRSRLTAYLCVIKGKRLLLIEIDPKAKQTAQGVSYRGQGGQRKLLAHAFMAVMKSGHRGVFKRVGKARLPIHELQGPSIAHVFLKPLMQERLQTHAQDRWPNDLCHELEFALRQRGYRK